LKFDLCPNLAEDVAEVKKLNMIKKLFLILFLGAIAITVSGNMGQLDGDAEMIIAPFFILIVFGIIASTFAGFFRIFKKAISQAKQQANKLATDQNFSKTIFENAPTIWQENKKTAKNVGKNVSKVWNIVWVIIIINIFGSVISGIISATTAADKEFLLETFSNLHQEPTLLVFFSLFAIFAIFFVVSVIRRVYNAFAGATTLPTPGNQKKIQKFPKSIPLLKALIDRNAINRDSIIQEFSKFKKITEITMLSDNRLDIAVIRKDGVPRRYMATLKGDDGSRRIVSLNRYA
jgi:hypothetical protein